MGWKSTSPILEGMRAALAIAMSLLVCACSSVEAVDVGVARDSVEQELREYYEAEAESPLARGKGDAPRSVTCTETDVPAWYERADDAHTCVLAFESGKSVTLCVISRGAHKLAWTVPEPCENLPRKR
jgi:hypothetical protein